MKVWKLRDIHYNHQTLRILAKKDQLTLYLLPNIHTYKKSLIFLTRWYCTYNSSTDTNAFFWSYLIAYDCTGHLEGPCLRTDISITSANCNHQNCKPRCIYQVLKFQSSHLLVTDEFTPFLRPSSAWSSCNMWKHQMLLSYSNTCLNQKL